MRAFSAIHLCLFLLVTVFASQTLTTTADAQGFLVPEDAERFHMPRPGRRRPLRTSSYRIKSIDVNTNIKGQIAETIVSQTFQNTGSTVMETTFVFPLPYDGAIDQLTFMVDGKELEAKLLPADKARSIYQGYVQRMEDPALLEWVGTGMFKTSVFPVPAGAERTVVLKYSQLLRKESNVVDYLFPLSTAKFTSHNIDTVDFRVAIASESKIKSIYSPTNDVKVTRDDDQHAVVKLSSKNVIPRDDFRLVFDTAPSEIGASVISYWPEGEDEGYFVLLASPEIKKADATPARKTVLFVVDRSGSMNGKKIEQAREAAKFVFNNLNENDLFNIVAYDTNAEIFNSEIQRYDDASRAQAIGFINGIHSGGSTNISEALNLALSSIKDDGTPKYIVFLSDGRPTVGEKNEIKIAAAYKKGNKYGARLINFGVGFDVNSRLIDRLSVVSNGQSEYVRPNEDIEAAVSRLFQKIQAPVLTNVAINYDFDQDLDVSKGKPVSRVYPSQLNDLFAGGQLILAGRYNQSGVSRVKIKGSVNEESKEYTFDLKFAAKGSSSNNKFVEKLWATRRIGEIIDQIDLNGRNDELVDELVRLSMKHGIMTPYTSFLADENAAPGQLTMSKSNVAAASDQLTQLDAEGGADAFELRLSKQEMKASGGIGRSGMAGGMAPGRGGGGRGAGSNSDTGIRNNKNSTLYRRGNIIIADNATDVDPEKDKSKIIEIKRFSKEYFDLVAKNTKVENEMLAGQRKSEELIIRLRGQVYRLN